eukprot:TRINITY_DN18_c0_g1_i21.p1 TRINITY_DN18_c0_g1~~TRINITY_DN18_c0_g1_i21.p1  ORF type:complete len:524 (+),score=123.35 TRINITY_DN18_c0_g1_i21:4998-6569(+)
MRVQRSSTRLITFAFAVAIVLVAASSASVISDKSQQNHYGVRAARGEEAIEEEEEHHAPIDEIYEEFDIDLDDELDEEELEHFLEELFDAEADHSGHDHKRYYFIKELKSTYKSQLGRAGEDDHADHEEHEVKIPTAHELIEEYDINNDTKVNKTEFREVSVHLVWSLLPMVVSLPEDSHASSSTSLTSGEKWAAGLISTLVVTLASVVAILFLPLGGNTPEAQRHLGYLLCYAVGNLIGDAILHLIPHTFGYLKSKNSIHSHTYSEDEHDHDVNSKATEYVLGTMLMVLLGIFIFFIMEAYLRMRSRRDVHVSPTGSVMNAELGNFRKGGDSEIAMSDRNEMTEALPASASPKSGAASGLHGHSHGSVLHFGYINLSSDAFHNFVDGLAIGAAYSASWSVGISTSIAVFVHEISQEIGDFVILLKAGFSRKQAIIANFSCAAVSFLGVIIGLGVGTNVEDSLMWILPLVAGGFLYIALCNMMPVILEQVTNPTTLLLDAAWLCAGFGMMVAMSYVEKALEDE